MAELTSGYESVLLDSLGKTNKWSGSYGPESFLTLMEQLSALSGSLFIALFSTFFLGYLIIRKKHTIFYTYVLVIFGAGMLHVVLKNFYGGDPWYNWLNLFDTSGKEFPSGHAMMAVVFYYTIARLIYRVTPSLKLNRYLLTIAFLLSFSIGIAQIIKGAHSPNDIIAGWSIGFAWIASAWLIDHWVRKKIYLKMREKNFSMSDFWSK